MRRTLAADVRAISSPKLIRHGYDDDDGASYDPRATKVARSVMFHLVMCANQSR